MYNSQIFTKLKILRNHKISQVRIDFFHTWFSNKITISLVFSLYPNQETSKIQEIVILLEKKEILNEINEIMNFFSLDYGTILDIAQNSQDSLILKLSEWKGNRKNTELGSFKFSFDYEQYKTGLKFISQEKNGINYSCYQKQLAKGDFSQLYETILGFILRKNMFVLTNFSFVLIPKLDYAFFSVFNATMFRSFQFNFLLMIDLMTKHFLYFFQKTKMKKGGLKNRKEIFREIYTNLLAEFRKKLEKHPEMTHFYEKNYVLKRCSLKFYLFD